MISREPLTPHHAEVLARATQIPARIWLALEHNYRAGLAAGLKDVDMTAATVHLAGPTRPFAACQSFDAAERHTRDVARVTCLDCLNRTLATLNLITLPMGGYAALRAALGDRLADLAADEVLDEVPEDG